MEPAKLRVFFGIAGGLMALVGFSALAVALVIALSATIGWAWATVTAAALYLAAACGFMFLCLKPQKSAQAEIGQLEDATAEALADLPFDTVESIVDKRPITVAIVAAIAGYSLFRDPSNVVKTGQRLLTAML